MTTDLIDIRLVHPNPQRLRVAIEALRRAGFHLAFEHPPARAAAGWVAVGHLDEGGDRWERALRAALAAAPLGEGFR